VRHVVTAAHCVRNDKIGEPVAVVLGELDVTTDYDCLDTEEGCGASGRKGQRCLEEENCAPKAQKYRVESTLAAPMHDEFGGGESFRPFPIYDVAVVVLAKSVRFTNFIQPVCLPDPTTRSSFDSPNQPLRVTGWGNEAFGFEQRSAKVLQELALEEIKLSDCRDLLLLDLLKSQMCVEASRDNSQACEGDSGSPVSRLNRASRRDPGIWELGGVVSFGASTACGAKAPLVVTRIDEAAVLSWLKRVVGQDRPDYPDKR
jgi:hypothetical protein